MTTELMGSDVSQWILDTMVSMTLLMAIVLLLRKPVSHFFGPKIAYLLWTLPLARLFMPTLTLEAPAAVQEPVAAPAMTTVNDLAASAPVQQASAGMFASVDWLLIAAIIWVGGAGMLFISKLAAYFQFKDDIVSDGQLVGRHGNIKILETAAVGGPLAFGLFRKYIVVPTDFFRNYAPRERELALEHEIAHHESGDLAANFVGLMVLSLHWFNPIAWFSWIAFRQDQETACDARILQQSGQEARAIYGRTIAKSASGHRLGLASPLNQKDKIKGRLKMLGQGEKSGLRKRLGALMVGASTVIALPMTATVVYAEAEVAEEAHPEDLDSKVQVQNASTSVDVGADGVLVTEKTKKGYKYTISNKRGTYEFESKRKLKKSEIDKKLSRMVPSFRKTSAPIVPEPPARPMLDQEAGEVVNITMLNGSKDFAGDDQYVHRIRHDGRTIVLRTNRKLSDEEAREQVEEAEESRREAEADLREHKRDMKEHEREMRHEMREVEREVEQARRDVEREMREMQREVERSVREADREAREAARESRISSRASQRQSTSTNRKTSRVWSIANQVAEISFSPRAPRAPKPVPIINVPAAPQPDCVAMNKNIAFGGKKNGMSNAAWAVVAGCGNFEVKIDEVKLMKMTLKGLEKDRAEAAKCSRKDRHHQKKMRAYDRDIKQLKRQLSII